MAQAGAIPTEGDLLRDAEEGQGAAEVAL